MGIPKFFEGMETQVFLDYEIIYILHQPIVSLVTTCRCWTNNIKTLFLLYQRPANSSSAAMSMRVQGTSGMHAYGPNVPRAGLVPGAAAALEQARRRQDAKNRRR